MHLLPRLSLPAPPLSVVKCQLSVIICIAFLFTIHYSLFTRSAFAQSAPDPQPCQNAVGTDKLTDNYITDQFGSPPEGMKFTVRASGQLGETVTVTGPTVTYTVDFSRLQAIFGANNANYLEGKYQDEAHRQARVMAFPSSDFNKYHGPGQKIAPKSMLDDLRVAYVNHVYNKPELAESADTFADIYGDNPKTIWDLVQDYGLPQPPSLGGDANAWLNGWGKYWPKIPTAYNEFYQGKLEFRSMPGRKFIEKTILGEICPLPLPRIITFVMPEFFRTTATSGQVNQVVVPKAAQPQEGNSLILGAAKGTKNALAQIVEKCLALATQNPVSKALRKVIKVTLDNLNPAKIAYAQEGACVNPEIRAKIGGATFCALPQGQLQPGESCANVNSPNKLDQGNPNVICTFRINWSAQLTIGEIDPGPVFGDEARPGYFDSCSDNNGDGIYDCEVKVAVWPVFRIPWLAEIWNNTLYSDAAEGGIDSQQVTGRPGVYTSFRPKGTEEQQTNQLITDINEDWVNDCFGSTESALVCQTLIYRLYFKRLAGKTQTEQGIGYDERFIGGTDCNKEFVRDVSLKPVALQKYLGVIPKCGYTRVIGAPGQPLVFLPPGASPPPIPPPVDCPTEFGLNPHPTTVEELECYIIQLASGDTEPLSGQNLAQVMITIMNAESSSDQCAFGSYGEIGVFQFIASTWHGQHPDEIDSGTVTTAPCWGIPGVDPFPTADSSDPFRWDIQFSGTNDGGAWNPFLQISTTRQMMLDGGACNWTTFRDIFGGC